MIQRIECELTFFSLEEGGRSYPPALQGGAYRPHLIVGDPSNRGNMDAEHDDQYLGVMFEAGPENVASGKSVVAIAVLLYPGVNYEALKPNAGFTIREGRKAVGYGKVLRWLPSSDAS